MFWKLIKTYTRLDMFEAVHQALNKEGYTSMTVVEAEGTGSYSDPDHQHQWIRSYKMTFK